MTRSLLSLRTLVVTAAVALVACGPRLKPVEYEEPKGTSSGDSDETEPSSSHKSKSTSGSADSSGSASGEASSSSKGGPFKSCDEKANTCGAPCTECEPGNMDCMEVLVVKHCNMAHKCVAAAVDCTAPAKSDKEKSDKEKSDKDKKKDAKK